MLRIEAITKNYGRTAVLNGIDLTLAPGELCTLLGPSGCGKTTLLRIVAGLEQQTTGRIWIDGVDVSQHPPFERQIGMVFQSYALFPHLLVEDNIRYGLELTRQTTAQRTEAVRNIANILGLEKFLRRRINQLSGGQQQRVALARALVLQPKILLFDEPLSNLDAKLRRGIREEIRTLQQRFGITAIYVTHDQSEALAISDRVVIMRDGHIEQTGTPHQLYDTPGNPFVANFIGDANLLPVTVAAATANTVHITLGDFCWTDTAPTTRATAYDLLLRPERITLQAKGPGLSGTITKAVFVGHAMEYHLQFGWGTLFVIDNQIHTPWTPGQIVSFDPTAAHPTLVPRV